MSVIDGLCDLHDGFFRWLNKATDGWFVGLAARFVFAGVLMVYFLNSASTKVGSGFPDMFIAQAGAYAQILPPIAEEYGYDASAIPFFPYGLIVYAGTYAEFLLPVLIVIGLFTRVASLGMIIFIAVMTYIDIYFHDADAKAIGALFDRIPDSPIADQRLLWSFLLLVLVLRGPGLISLDAVLGRLFRTPKWAD